MKRWKIDFGGSVIVEADDQYEAEALARERVSSDGDWAEQRRCRQISGFDYEEN